MLHLIQAQKEIVREVPPSEQDIEYYANEYTMLTRLENALSADLELAVQSAATIVILMGMSKLKAIVALLNKYGKSHVPAAIIQNGTTVNEKIGAGTVATLEEVKERNDLTAPAIIIIGEVVKESLKLEAFYRELAVK